MKIGYSKTYPITHNGTWEKIWIETEITGTEEDARKELYSLKKQVENFHYESNKAAEKQLAEVKKEEPKSQEEKIIAQIKEITDSKVLEGFSLLAKKYPNVQLVYNDKLKQLQL